MDLLFLIASLYFVSEFPKCTEHTFNAGSLQHYLTSTCYCLGGASVGSSFKVYLFGQHRNQALQVLQHTVMNTVCNYSVPSS